ncbi:MAG: 6-bladed beta-propeller [Tannerella sp.]|jgi:hypothetical protein|nr:6-bladed beta-propeller [Tannerella sp.]
MKTINFLLASFLSLAILSGCENERQSTEDFITVDVTKSYPKKELILQDFADVEYIVLETNDDFLTQGIVMDIGKEIMVVKNRLDGDIFIFDRKTGKALKKINRKGHGGEEYVYPGAIRFDESNKELFVNDVDTRKIYVYDLDGNFKRSFKHKEGAIYFNIVDFDKNNLISFDGNFPDYGMPSRQQFAFVSKQDGSTKQIEFHFTEKKTEVVVKYLPNNASISTNAGGYFQIRKYMGDLFLVELSSDTIFRYQSKNKMDPVIVRTPSIQSMMPEVFLWLSCQSDRYYFMETMKKTVDWETMKGLPRTDLVYDKQEKTIYEYAAYNDDYEPKRHVDMNDRFVNDEIVTWVRLDAYQLVDDYNKGRLKGKLKEIASTMDEEDNPVIMLIKPKI